MAATGAATRVASPLPTEHLETRPACPGAVPAAEDLAAEDGACRVPGAHAGHVRQPGLSPGRAAAVAWLAEELGELSQAVRKGSPDAAAARARRRPGLAGLAGQPARSFARGGGEPLRGGCPAAAIVPCGCP